MRAREFITEAAGGVHPHHVSVQQGVTRSRDVGGYDRIYYMNRLWMATALADGKDTKAVDMDSASWIEKYNSEHPYTEEEHRMFQSAHNTIPSDTKEIMPWSKSKEPGDTNVASPLPKPTRNRFGV